MGVNKKKNYNENKNAQTKQPCFRKKYAIKHVKLFILIEFSHLLHSEKES